MHRCISYPVCVCLCVVCVYLPSYVRVGIKAVPRKLAYGIKAISELDEDKTKIVGDVAKPKAA